MRQKCALALALMLLASTAFAQGMPCEICVNETYPSGAPAYWCHSPADGEWGFDQCTMYTDAQGNERCRTGWSQCLYSEYNGGNGTDGGSGVNDPNRDDSGACPAEYASCG